jgi:hypothetical protein
MRTKEELMKKIVTYKQDITILKTMLSEYEKTFNLQGIFASEMCEKINEQIQFCEECIENLENLRT